MHKIFTIIVRCATLQEISREKLGGISFWCLLSSFQNIPEEVISIFWLNKRHMQARERNLPSAHISLQYHYDSHHHYTPLSLLFYHLIVFDIIVITTLCAFMAFINILKLHYIELVFFNKWTIVHRHLAVIQFIHILWNVCSVSVKPSFSVWPCNFLLWYQDI